LIITDVTTVKPLAPMNVAMVDAIHYMPDPRRSRPPRSSWPRTMPRSSRAPAW
jgi:hypothetical protein